MTIDGEERELLARSLRHLTETTSGPGLDAALAELGWPDALEADPRTAISLLFGLQGAAHTTSSALDHVLLGPHAPPTGIVLPALGRWDPPGRLDGDRLDVAGLGSAALAGHDTALVVTGEGNDALAVRVPVAALAVRTVQGVDPQLGLVEVEAEGVVVAGPPEPAPDWGRAVALARLGLGHELVGASRTMLELARTHALERVQFDRPISQFQAVRHRLADTLVAIETAEAVLDAAWLDGSPRTAAMAKALAGRGARTASRHCQQVLAGIGFTTEHPLQLHIRRVLVLDQLLGAARTLTTELGDELRASRQLPPLLPL